MLQYPPESQGSCRGQAFLVRAFSFSFSFHILFFYFLSRDPFKPGRYLPCPGYSRSGAIRCRLGCSRSIEEKKRGNKEDKGRKEGRSRRDVLRSCHHRHHRYPHCFRSSQTDGHGKRVVGARIVVRWRRERKKEVNC
jgi:hypothetical protein